MRAILIIILVLLFEANSRTQTYSDITYSAGTIIEVQSGADVCANNIYINGTFSGGGTICSGALPVSISSFTYTVSKKDVTLKWVTEWELNNSGFRVERKKTGENYWIEAGFIQGYGTINESKQYTFNDINLKTGKYDYRLIQIDFNGNYEYFSLQQEVNITSPKSFEVGQSYPNPSNPRSKIDYQLPEDARVMLKIYDVLGREVGFPLNENKKAGYYSFDFDGTNFSSGIYFCIINAVSDKNKYSKTIKLILVK